MYSRSVFLLLSFTPDPAGTCKSSSSTSRSCFSPCNHPAPWSQRGPVQFCQFPWSSVGRGQASLHILPVKPELRRLWWSKDVFRLPIILVKIPCFAHTCCPEQHHREGGDRCCSFCWWRSSWRTYSPDPIKLVPTILKLNNLDSRGKVLNAINILVTISAK